MGVKISQLPEVLSANSNDYLVINHEGATSQIMVETLMDSYLSSAGFITESDLADYLSSNLGNYLSEYVTKSDLENCRGCTVPPVQIVRHGFDADRASIDGWPDGFMLAFGKGNQIGKSRVPDRLFANRMASLDLHPGPLARPPGKRRKQAGEHVDDALELVVGRYPERGDEFGSAARAPALFAFGEIALQLGVADGADDASHRIPFLARLVIQRFALPTMKNERMYCHHSPPIHFPRK